MPLCGLHTSTQNQVTRQLKLCPGKNPNIRTSTFISPHKHTHTHSMFFRNGLLHNWEVIQTVLWGTWLCSQRAVVNPVLKSWSGKVCGAVLVRWSQQSKVSSDNIRCLCVCVLHCEVCMVVLVLCRFSLCEITRYCNM